MAVASAETDREVRRDAMAKRRAQDRIVYIPACEDPKRRKRLEKNTVKWLQFYLPELFDMPFTDDHKTIITDVERVIEDGGYLSIAAPRGDGKTTLIKGLLIKAIATGAIGFPVAIGATGAMAKDSILDGVCSEFQRSDVLNQDYPEVCTPIRALEGSARRAGMQTCVLEGTDDEPEMSDFSWSGDGVIFPTVKGSHASKTVFRSRGADAAIRGMNVRGRRPDFVLIDDPDTDESAVSEHLTAKRIKLIKNGISRLGKGNKRLGVVMLCTIIAKDCIADQFTDRKKEPAWHGRRIKMLREWPERTDLWDTYTRMRVADQNDDNADGTNATQFYKDNRADMDMGAEVSNETRFDPAIQLSALQTCYDIIADDGMESFLTECQNDPPEQDGMDESAIHPMLVSGSINGFTHRQAPDWAKVITMGVDVGQSLLHYVVKAWGDGAKGAVIDYGVVATFQPKVVGVEEAILRALRSLRDELVKFPYVNSDGEPIGLNAAMIDSGWQDLPVHQFCNESGQPWFAAKGFGSAKAQSPFSAKKPTKKVQIGEHWYRTPLPPKGFLRGFDADWWKRWEHDRWIMDHRTEDGIRDGSMTLWGDDPSIHKTFADHICGEVQEQEIKNKVPVWKWVRKAIHQHWFDGSVMASVAGAMCGIHLQGQVAKAAPRRRRARVTGGWNQR
jgi:hypothetical protein